jgi:hypothetical protein
MRNRIGRPRFMQSFTSAGGGPFLATPPSDGETYGVRNADTWIEVCEEAPKNGTLYGRVSNAWQPIPSGGDPGTATGVLFTPAGDISATNVQAAIQELDNEKVAKAGSTMTGFLTLHANPDAPMKAATKQYVDTALGNAGVTISDTAPTPNQGKMWWESDTGVLWMSYTDASSTQWIGVGGTTAAISDASKADKTYVDAQDALKADKTYVDAQDLLSVLRDGTRTMTGDLTIEKNFWPALKINRTVDTVGCYILGQSAGVSRWQINLVEPNVAADLKVYRYNDVGTAIDAPLTISRATGAVALSSTVFPSSPTTGALIVAGGIGIGGDVISGAAFIAMGSAPTIIVRKQVSGQSCGYYGQVGGAPRWFAAFGDDVAEGGSNTGSNFGIYRYSDAGTFLGAALSIARNTGNVAIPATTASTSPTTGALTVAGGVGIGGAINTAGNVTLRQSVEPILIFDKALGVGTASIHAKVNGLLRWGIALADNNETGSNAGSDFNILRCNDAGAVLGSALYITRSTGAVTLSSTASSTSPTTGSLTVAGGVGIGGSVFVGGNMTITRPAGNTAGLVLDTAGATDDSAIFFRNGGAQKWQIGNGANYAHAFIVLDAQADSGVSIPQNGTSWAAFSDRRMRAKQNARTVSGLLGKLDHFRLVEYGQDHSKIGVIAQELHLFMSQLTIHGDDDDRMIDRVDVPGVWRVLPSEAAFVALQIGKELNERLDALERRLRV